MQSRWRHHLPYHLSQSNGFLADVPPKVRFAAKPHFSYSTLVPAPKSISALVGSQTQGAKNDSRLFLGDRDEQRVSRRPSPALSDLYRESRVAGTPRGRYDRGSSRRSRAFSGGVAFVP